RGADHHEGPRHPAARAGADGAVDPWGQRAHGRGRPPPVCQTGVRATAVACLPRRREPGHAEHGLMPGPLAGVKVVELASIGPIPFCGMVLSDMGCDVVRVDKPADAALADASRAPGSVLDRGRRSIALDLKSEAGREIVLRLVDGADVLIEGYRPGVAERLGVGPADCHER